MYGGFTRFDLEHAVFESLYEYSASYAIDAFRQARAAPEPVNRDQLLREKEAELARILDQHDDLVGHTVSKGHLSLKQLLIWF